ncbi:MAG: 2'-5' RNA ligase family protein [Propylenella sp.]
MDEIAERLEEVAGLQTVRRIGDVHHISLGVYDDVSVEQFVDELQRFAETVVPIPIRLAMIGVFPGARSVLYLGPVVTEELLALHRRYHAALAGFAQSCWEHYRREHWVPHVTLALEIEPEALEEAVAAARKHWAPHDARLDAMRFIRFRPVETLYLRALSNSRRNAT